MSKWYFPKMKFPKKILEKSGKKYQKFTGENLYFFLSINRIKK